MLAADVLLFPSRAEGMGMVAVEAQAAGLPVCASSAVPDEIVVIKELVEFVSLEKSYLEWVTVLNDLARRRRDFDTTADVRWQKSPFNIKVCWDRLKEIYSNGEVASNIRKEE
jgi:glycosyltransferase involved in cell wall biosynthesis